MELFKVDSLKKVFLHLGIIFLLFMGLLLFFFYVYLPGATRHGETVTVPKLVGMNTGELENFLSSKNLRFKINDSTFTPGVKPFTVLTQHPLPDAKVKENRMIYVTIAAKNPPEVEMPQLKDLSLKGAKIQLSQHGLVLDEHIIYVPGEPDVVYDQLMRGKHIDPGTKIAKGSKISLKVGQSAGDIPVPPFNGMTVEAARTYAMEVGVQLEIYPDANATGTIYKQKPSPDEVSTMKKGETVDVWVK